MGDEEAAAVGWRDVEDGGEGWQGGGVLVGLREWVVRDKGVGGLGQGA